MSMMTIELRKERKEARHQSTCIHMVTYCKTRWVRSRSPTMLSICLVIGRAGASPPSRTAAIIFLFIYLPFVRRALNLLRASFSPIFQYFSAGNDTRVSFSPIFHFNIS